ncbi:MAG: YsnF/AvaK domain-containing protein [Acidobacteriaceae bacterium]
MANETNAAGVGATQVVIGLFNNSNDAQAAVTQLRASGFSATQIGAAFRNAAAEPRSAGRSTDASKAGAVKRDAENWWQKVKDAFRPDDDMENRREVAAASEPSVDPYGAGRYTLDDNEYDYAGEDIEGSLTESGIPSHRAAYLSRNLQRGGAIVTVRDTNRTAEAEQILSANHGKVRYEEPDVNRAAVAESAYATSEPSNRSGDLAAGRSYADAPAKFGDEPRPVDAATFTGRAVTDTGDTGVSNRASRDSLADRVQLFGEVLRVHKDRVSRGEVRVRKDVVTEDQSIEVPITREELVLERVEVPSTPAPSAKIGQSQEVRVPLAEDRVRVEKQPVVREEVKVGKREVADVARVGDQVRHEELRVDSDVEPPRKTVADDPAKGDLRRRG